MEANALISEAEPRMKAVNTRSWFGYATIENIGEIFSAIERFLTIDGQPRYYTFVALNKNMATLTDVRTSQHADPSSGSGGKAFFLSYHKYIVADTGEIPHSIELDGPEDANSAHVTVVDTYGAWGFSTRATRETPHDELLKRGAYVVFDRGQIEIRQLNGYGEVLVWRIAPERHADEPHWNDGKAERW